MSRLATGLDRLLARLADEPRLLAERRWALLGHGASVTARLEPAHLALMRAAGAPPSLLLGPEHGYYGVEQDMVPARSERDPWTGAAVASLYGDSADSLTPSPEVFAGVDLLVIDLQDVGSRYYTYAATAAWAAEAALAAGCEVWVLDRPNPLGGERVEGPPVEPGFESFVGAFPIPVRHGLTLGELVRLDARRRGWGDGLSIWALAGWSRADGWEETGRPWIAPSPNMPAPVTARLYPGLCLVEATRLSEGRGTTRPFQLVGAPQVDPLRLAEALAARLGPEAGLAALPTYFRPQFQKHAGERCGGIELAVTDPERLRPFRAGVELLAAVAEAAPDAFGWRRAPYEFVTDRPAVDLLTGSETCRRALEGEGRSRRLDRHLAGRRGGVPRGAPAGAPLPAAGRAGRRPVRRIHLLRTTGEGPAALEPLFAAARAAGLRIGWLDLAASSVAPPAPAGLEPAAAAGAFRAVAVGGGRSVSVKPTAGPPVLGDLLREHFLGCALVIVREPEEGTGESRLAAELEGVARLAPARGRWWVTLPGAAARELSAEELAARLRRPRPWDARS